MPKKGFTLPNVHDFVINNPQFLEHSMSDSNLSSATHGLWNLLKVSMPDTFHDSFARDPPPSCAYGSRYVERMFIAAWGEGTPRDFPQHVLWVDGPPGAGKTALAQTCADSFAKKNQLAGSVFFSRSSSERSNAGRLFTSIAYQIAKQCKPFAKIIGEVISRDPTLGSGSLQVQFKELLINPLRQLQNDHGEDCLKGRVVIIDGLDECGSASTQSLIVNIIADSA